MYSFPKDTHRLHEYPNVLVTLNKSICQMNKGTFSRLSSCEIFRGMWLENSSSACQRNEYCQHKTTIMQRSQIYPGCVLFQLNSYLLIQWLAVVFYLDEGNTNIQLQFKHHLCPWTWSRLPCLLSLSTFVDEEVWLRIFFFFLQRSLAAFYVQYYQTNNTNPLKLHWGAILSTVVNAFTYTALCWEWKYLV